MNLPAALIMNRLRMFMQTYIIINITKGIEILFHLLNVAIGTLFWILYIFLRTRRVSYIFGSLDLPKMHGYPPFNCEFIRNYFVRNVQ